MPATSIPASPSKLVLADAFFAVDDSVSLLLKRALLFTLGVMVIILASKLRIPAWPVPMTLQTFAVLAIGAAYGPRLGLVTVAGWLFLGALGANVFAASGEAAGGLSYMLGGTGGYLAGFALAAFVVGVLARRGWDRTPIKTVGAMIIGNALIYIPGLLWLGRVHGFDAPILSWGLYPFLVGDAVKLALAAAVFPTAWRAVDKMKR